MNSLVFQSYQYQFTTNIIKNADLRKPLTTKLFIPAISNWAFLAIFYLPIIYIMIYFLF